MALANQNKTTFLFLPVAITDVIKYEEEKEMAVFKAVKRSQQEDGRFKANEFNIHMYFPKFMGDIESFRSQLAKQKSGYGLFVDGYWRKKEGSNESSNNSDFYFACSSYLTLQAYRENGFIGGYQGDQIYINGQFMREILKSKEIKLKSSSGITLNAIGYTDNEINALFSHVGQPTHTLSHFRANSADLDAVSGFTNPDRKVLLKQALQDMNTYAVLHQYSYLRLLGLSEGVAISMLNEYGPKARNEILKDPLIIIDNVEMDYIPSAKGRQDGDDDLGSKSFASVVESLDYKGQEDVINNGKVIRALEELKSNGNLSSPIETNPSSIRFEHSIVWQIIKNKYQSSHGRSLNKALLELRNNSQALTSEIFEATNIIESVMQSPDAELRITNWYRAGKEVNFTLNDAPLPVGAIAGPRCISKLNDFILENEISDNLIRLMGNGRKELPRGYNVPESLSLYDAQKQGVIQSLMYKLSIITGGPGVGKTYVLSAVLDSLSSVSNKPIKARMIAPTGKAATRIKESTNDPSNSEFVRTVGQTANTIDSVIGISSEKGRIKSCRYNESNKLDADLFIIDEASMVDAYKFNALLKAIPDHARLIIVGDKDQIPSVDSGSMLEEMIKSKRIPFVILNETRRQGKGSDIVSTAYSVIDQVVPELKGINHPDANDLIFIETDSDSSTNEEISRLIKHQLMAVENYDIDDIQLITYRNDAGSALNTTLMNKDFANEFNPKRNNKSNRVSDTDYFIGDRVLCTQNDQQTRVMNGNQGTISYYHAKTKCVAMKFSHLDKDIFVPIDDLKLSGSRRKFRLGNAITIHSSQGSEYPAVIIPLSTQDKQSLNAQLLYTAITRGKKKVFLVGSREVFEAGVARKQEAKRDGTLNLMLQSRLPALPKEFVNSDVKIILGGEDKPKATDTKKEPLIKAPAKNKASTPAFEDKIPF